MIPKTFGPPSGPVHQPPVEENATPEVANAPRAPDTNSRIDELFEAVKAHSQGKGDSEADIPKMCADLIACMSDMPDSLKLGALDHLTVRIAIFRDPQTLGVPAETRELVKSILHRHIGPAVLALDFQTGDSSAPANYSKWKGELWEVIQGLLLMPDGKPPELGTIASRVDAKMASFLLPRDLAMLANASRQSPVLAGDALKVVRAFLSAEAHLSDASERNNSETQQQLETARRAYHTARDELRKTALAYIANGYDSPQAQLVRAIQSLEDAPSVDEASKVFETAVKPCINSALGPDRSAQMDSAIRTRRPHTVDLLVKSSKDEALALVMDDLAGKTKAEKEGPKRDWTWDID